MKQATKKTSDQNNVIDNSFETNHVEQPNNTVYSVNPADYTYVRSAKIKEQIKSLLVEIDEVTDCYPDQAEKAELYINTVSELANTPGVKLISRPKVTTNLLFKEKCVFKDVNRPGWRAVVSISIHRAQKPVRSQENSDSVQTEEEEIDDK